SVTLHLTNVAFVTDDANRLCDRSCRAAEVRYRMMGDNAALLRPSRDAQRDAVHDGRRADVPLVRAIELEGVRKDFPLAQGGTFRALEGVNLSVEEGEFIALVGPSGCGKTSILRLVAALEEPSAGAVRVKGESPRRMAERHSLAIAFQEHALLPWLTVQA